MLLFGLLACRSGTSSSTESQAVAASAARVESKGGSSMFTLKSPAFANGESIPKQFSCEGSDHSPALAWNAPPSATQSFALVADDPDAPMGTWVHWVLYDLPGNARQLPEAIAKQEKIAGGGTQGTNDFGKIGYRGPCPPLGKPHRYFFKLYALDALPNLKPGSSKAQLEEKMQEHILAQAELMGTYKR
jgi:Raf kinase inhibitor-like YbhB/YbcL family protein